MSRTIKSGNILKESDICSLKINIMKNKLPLLLTILGGAGLVFWLRRKAQAGANLQFIPLDIAIDSRRSGLFRIYYSVKIRLINNETANVNIKGINLKAFIDNKFVGDIVNNASFNVPAKGTTDIKLDTSISTGSIARLIFQAITQGINFSMNINGFVDTDLGRVNVNFTKQVGEQGISAPYEYKVTDCLDSKDCQLAMDEIFSNQPGAKNDFSKLTQKEKTRYFRLKRRQDKFIQQGK